MIPVGYMYKDVCKKPDWLNTNRVVDIYSVSSCISRDFCDWISCWRHNGYWFFDNPKIMEEIALEKAISLDGMKLFFYRVYEQQWYGLEDGWQLYEEEKEFSTNVKLPRNITVEGFDLVSFYCETSPECSPLSCNHMARELSVNSHCLFKSFLEVKVYLEKGKFENCEPGPYRIFEVNSVDLV